MVRGCTAARHNHIVDHLKAAGSWDRAAEHASRYDDFPEQMHEGRQLLVIAAARGGRRDEALRLIDEASTIHPWQEAVAHCLRAYVDPDTCDVGELITGVQKARDAATDPVMTMFRIRLGLLLTR